MSVILFGILLGFVLCIPEAWDCPDCGTLPALCEHCADRVPCFTGHDWRPEGFADWRCGDCGVPR